MMKANKQIGFININEESIDKIIKDGEVVFERGFLREKISTTLPINFGGVGKDLKDYKIYGNTKQQILPDGYTQVDYIESSGTHYIDTGVNADSNLQTILDMAYMDSSLANQNVGTIHTINTTVNGRYHLLCQSYYFRFYANNKSVDIGQKDNNRHIFNFDIPNRKLYNDGNEYSIDIEDFDTELNFWLFGRNSNLSSLIYYSRIKQWACKMYYNGTLVRDFIPCYRNSDNEVGLYDLVNKVFYTNQGTGVFTYGNIAPTPDAPIEMVSCGDRTKNLIGFEDLPETTSNGVTYSIKDNVFTLNGTASDNIRYIYNNKYHLGNEGDYTLKIDVISGSWTAGIIGLSSKKSDNTQARYAQVAYNTPDLTQSKNYSNTEIQETVAIGFFINSGSVFNNFKFRIIFNEGSTAIAYEPYGYKIPVNVRSDNLFDKDNMTLNEYIRNDGTTLSTDYWDISDYIELEPNKTYTYNGLTSVGTSSVQSAYYDINKNFISTFKQAVGATTITTPSNAYYVRFSINKGANDKNTFQFKQGSTAPSKYISYYNETTNIYLEEPLRKIDEYSDYIDFVNSKVVRNIKEHVFTSNDDIRSGTASQDRYARVGWGAKSEIAVSDFNKSLVICNKFLGVPQNNNTPSITGKKWQCSLSNTGEYKIMFRSGDLNLNNAELISLIKSNTKVCYPLLTPTEESITLPNIPTIDGNNILNIETEITPSQVYIKYKSNN